MPFQSLLRCQDVGFFFPWGSVERQYGDHTLQKHEQSSAKVYKQIANQIKSSSPLSKQQMKTSTQSEMFDSSLRPNQQPLKIHRGVPSQGKYK